MDDIITRNQQNIELLEKATLLEQPALLAHFEIQDMRDTDRAFAEVVAQFNNDGGSTNAILKPIMYSVADGLIEVIPGGKAMRRRGLTPQRVISECESFSYPQNAIGPVPGVGYVDWKNAADFRAEYGNSPERAIYKRSKYEKPNAMQDYKDRKNDEAASHGRKNLMDEYTGENNITAYRKNPDMRRNDPTNSYQAQTDHILPLKELHSQFKGNYALSDSDIRNIANIDDNFALTRSTINESKGDRTNSQYIEDLRNSEDSKDRELADKLEANMKALEKEAMKGIEKATNKTVGKNLLFKGDLSRNERVKLYEAYKKKNKVKNLTPEQKREIVSKAKRDKTLAIYGKATSDAAKQGGAMAIGNLVMFMLKPLYYELADSFRNGFEKGVNCSSSSDAIRVRFTRMKRYVSENARHFLGDNAWELVKGFFSALMEGIIGLFVGLFKCVLKLIKEGIRIFVQASKILWGKGAAERTAAEKGDAIIKLIGTSVAGLAGIGVEALLNSIGIPDILSVPMSTMLSGIISALFLYFLDRADLFSVRAERRQARIKEVFDARIADMKQASAQMSATVAEKLKQDRLRYERLGYEIETALEKRDIKCLDVALDGVAAFFKVQIPYDDNESFAKYVKEHSVIRIGKIA